MQKTNDDLSIERAYSVVCCCEGCVEIAVSERHSSDNVFGHQRDRAGHLGIKADHVDDMDRVVERLS